MKKNKNIANDNMADHELRAIPGLDGYLIAPDGKLYSLSRKRFLSGQVSSTRKIGLFYRHYLLRKNGKNIRVAAHRMVFEAYKGPVPEKMVIHHSDGNGINNDIANLQAMTRREHARKIMIRWYICLIYSSVYEDRKNGASLSDIAAKYDLDDEIIETLLEKKLDAILKDLSV